MNAKNSTTTRRARPAPEPTKAQAEETPASAAKPNLNELANSDPAAERELIARRKKLVQKFKEKIAREKPGDADTQEWAEDIRSGLHRALDLLADEVVLNGGEDSPVLRPLMAALSALNSLDDELKTLLASYEALGGDEAFDELAAAS